MSLQVIEEENRSQLDRKKKTRRENRRTINFDWSRSGCNVFVGGLFISSFSLRLIQAVDEKETLYLNSVIKSNYIYDNNPCCFLQNTKSIDSSLMSAGSDFLATSQFCKINWKSV